MPAVWGVKKTPIKKGAMKEDDIWPKSWKQIKRKKKSNREAGVTTVREAADREQHGTPTLPWTRMITLCAMELHLWVKLCCHIYLPGALIEGRHMFRTLHPDSAWVKRCQTRQGSIFRSDFSNSYQDAHTQNTSASFLIPGVTGWISTWEPAGEDQKHPLLWLLTTPSVQENDKNHQNSATEAPEKGINYWKLFLSMNFSISSQWRVFRIK